MCRSMFSPEHISDLYKIQKIPVLGGLRPEDRGLEWMPERSKQGFQDFASRAAQSRRLTGKEVRAHSHRDLVERSILQHRPGPV